MHITYDKDNSLTKDPKKILQIQAQYYKKLYTSNKNISASLDDTPRNVLSIVQKQNLDRELTIEELGTAIKEMSKDKTPGISGFQVNVYIMFWNRLKEPLFNAFRYAFETGILNNDARIGLISLIPKKERNLHYVKNWRPIVLLNTDYKILAKAIANRMKTVLPGIIGEDQSGFMKSRLISTNLRKILDTINYAEKQQIPGIFVVINFEKAFDRVEYSALMKILEWFNFGKIFCRWVKFLFTNMQLATLNNGYTSVYFSPSRALFQGNPIASFLFIVVIEILAIRICNNKRIKGIKIHDEEILLCLFADDLGMLLEYNAASWGQVVNELDWFQNNTGMLINYEKQRYIG